MDNIGIVSKKDRRICLEKVGDKYGATLENLDREYEVRLFKTYSGSKPSYIATQLYLWINRSGSLREMSEVNYENFKRFSKYLVLYNEKDDHCYLLYNVSVEPIDVRCECIRLKAELSIKLDDIFEAMRLINADEIHEAFVEEFERLRDEVEIVK